MIDKFSTKEYFALMDKYFRASNYLSVAQLYLKNNPLLRHPFKKDDIKSKIVGHWGTVPGQNFIYTHLNRVIKKYNLNLMLITGPGHGGNFYIANSYLEGVYSEVYPEVTQDMEGMTRLCKQFSFPGGVSSHASPEVPGSIHEGGELGYSLVHAYGSVLDNPDLITACIIGDGEAETATLATSWHLNKFIDPQRDGVVLPILHLNGYKINNPTILARIPRRELISLLKGYGYTPYFVEGDDSATLHAKMAKAMDDCIKDIKNLKKGSFLGKFPVLVLVTPKGWTCPKVVNDLQIEGTFRAHQVPVPMTKKEDQFILEEWLKSYKPDELFDENYQLREEIRETIPRGSQRISANPHANGGNMLHPLIYPKINEYLLDFKKPGKIKTQDTTELSKYIRDLMQLNPDDYRIFSPDETMSNRLYNVFDTQNRTFNAKINKNDDHLDKNGRVFDSFLSENICEGLLEGYILTGRHGCFDSYEAFIRVVDSMISQHAKWITSCATIPWRKPVSSLNLILTSNVWQQDHNGFTHQDPGLMDMMISKSLNFTHIYLPADTNTLLYTFDKCTRSKNSINIIHASKHPSYQWFSPKIAQNLVEKGVDIVDFACLNDKDHPDIIIASCGDTATLEALASITLIKEYLPTLNVRFVNVVNLCKLSSYREHAEALSQEEFDNIFTLSTPVIFNFHGYPKLIHELIYKRHNQDFHVSGYQEKGTITTPFDMRVRNEIDRYHILLKVLQYAKLPKTVTNKISNIINEKLEFHNQYIREYGVDMPEITNWEFK